MNMTLVVGVTVLVIASVVVAKSSKAKAKKQPKEIVVTIMSTPIAAGGAGWVCYPAYASQLKEVVLVDSLCPKLLVGDEVVVGDQYEQGDLVSNPYKFLRRK